MRWAIVALSLAVVYLLLWVRIHARYDRLLVEVERTRRILEQRLHARSLEALRWTRELDPASAALVGDLAERALSDDGSDPRRRAQVESELSAGLRAVLGHAAGNGPEELLARWNGLAVARNLHNTRVTQAADLRTSRIGRVVALGGAIPATFDMDDELPRAGHNH